MQLINREIGANIAYVAANLIRLIFKISGSLPDELRDVEHFRLAKAAGGDRRRTHTLAGGNERAFWIVRDGVLVRGDI